MIDKKTASVFIFFFTICITGLFATPCIYAKNLSAGIVLADEHGNILYGQNREKQFVPASILKILTSLAAVQILGKDYRFPTDYFFDESSKNLYIKGFGDPLFTSEVIEQLCDEISLKVKLIHHIILDQTYFSKQIRVPGKGNSSNPYDAPVGALCANFNTIMFTWSVSEGRFISAEPQTPLLSVFYDDIKKTMLKKGRIILSKQQSLLYPGLLLKYFFEKNNIKVTGSVLQGKFEVKEEKKCSFLSPFEIKNIVQKLLKYSNNYIANQLLLTIGAKIYGTPATLEKGIKALKLYSKQNLKLDHFTILEGSGLSRSNLISPDQMLKVLIEFMPFHSLLNFKGNEFFKTGTLLGVRTRAGYILGNDNRLYPYVIMVNKKNKGCESIRKNLINIIFQINKNQAK
ncbi:MAG: D-alanyl-D-alanine carboxypeptidase [Desulfobacula sp.]|nr:D-alanyl-D-alanine carboxypeptidase [Desulfobacula sp.]